MPPDPKPARRIVAPGAGVQKVCEEGRCRVCRKRRYPVSYGLGAYAGLTRHHLVPRSLGGDDVDENIVPLCGHGTAGCHGLVEHRDAEACRKLRAALRPEEMAYMVAKKSLAFVDRYYPEGGE